MNRVYERRTPHDGSRILVDRLWPRGLTKVAADLDEWCKQVAPSTELRTWYHHGSGQFPQFADRYRIELEELERATALAHLRELARAGTITLLTASKQPEFSHAQILADLLNI